MMNENWSPTDSKNSIEVVAAISDTFKIEAAINDLNFQQFDDILTFAGLLSKDNIDQYKDSAKEYIESGYILPVILTSSRHSEDLSHIVSSEYSSTAIISHKTSLTTKNSSEYTTYIGAQGHFYDPQEANTDRIVRLNEVRHHHERAEVALRNVDTAIIDLSAIRQSDNFGHPSSWPTGLTTEEMCQIAQYIGASTNLKAVLIRDYQPDKDSSGVVARNIALIVWYICNGYRMRLAEKKHSEVNTYMIYADHLDTELVFTENKHSGRWWLQIPSTLSDEDYITVPCTAKDYEAICRDEIPDKIAKLCAL